MARNQMKLQGNNMDSNFPLYPRNLNLDWRANVKNINFLIALGGRNDLEGWETSFNFGNILATRIPNMRDNIGNSTICLSGERYLIVDYIVRTGNECTQ
jgi:hypothetical protein